MKWSAGSIDHPIPGCKSANWSNVIKYQKLVHDGAHPQAIQQHFNPDGIAPNEKRYGMQPHGTSTKPSSAHGPRTPRDSSAHRSRTPRESDSSAHRSRTPRESASPKPKPSRTHVYKQRDSHGVPGGTGRSLRPMRSSHRSPTGKTRPRDEGAMHLLSNAFDLCDAGSVALQDWSPYKCGQHIGPCCGDGVCDVASGETSLHCASDCGSHGDRRTI